MSSSSSSIAIALQQVTNNALQIGNNAQAITNAENANATTQQLISNLTLIDQSNALVGVANTAIIASNTKQIDEVRKSMPTGVLVFGTKAELDMYAPENADKEKASFKVTNDSDSALNGYYHWVSGTTYAKDHSLALGDVIKDNDEPVTGGKVFSAINNTVKGVAKSNNDRFEIIESAGLFVKRASLLYTDEGTPKAQSALYSGYATALNTALVGDFDKVDLHIQLDAPTPCKVTVFDSLFSELVTVDIDGVNGWNSVLLPRTIGGLDGAVVYIGIETISRAPMTITTFTAPVEYAATGSFPVKGSLIASETGDFSITVSSQYTIPFRVWNTHALVVQQYKEMDSKTKQLTPILAGALTTKMADTKTGELTGVYGNFSSTVVGRGASYLTPVIGFDSFRTSVRLESKSAVRVYLKTDTLDDIEVMETGELEVGDHFLSMALSKIYTQENLGTQFYICVESIGHVSRLSPASFVFDESKFPQPTNAYPLKSTSAEAEENTWVGGGSSTGSRLYVEFFKLDNVTSALAKAVENAESTSTVDLAIPSQFYSVDGKNDQKIYYGNVIKSIDTQKYLFDINANNSGRMSKDEWQARKVGVGTSTITSKLYNADRVLLDSKVSTLNQVDTTAGSGKTPKVLCIGDSITARGFYTQGLLDIAVGDAMNIDLIGTLGTAPNQHEGYGGKTIDWLYADEGSPFVFSGVFDFSQYMSSNGYASVDYITLLLGANDVGGVDGDSEAITISESAAAQVELMIANFKLFNPSVKIGFMLALAAGRDQDAYGIVYSDSKTAWRYQSNRHEWCKTMINNFDARLNEDIYVIPTNCTINTDAAYSVADPIHPIDVAGYADIANSLWSFLKVKEA